MIGTPFISYLEKFQSKQHSIMYFKKMWGHQVKKNCVFGIAFFKGFNLDQQKGLHNLTFSAETELDSLAWYNGLEQPLALPGSSKY